MQIKGYSCDVCGKVKTELNHWFLGRVSSSIDGLVVIIQGWDEHQLANSDHICGQECLTKWTSRRAEQINS